MSSLVPSDSNASVTSESDDQCLLIREGDIAGDYLERLLDIMDFDGDIDIDVAGNRAVVDIVGSGLASLIGPKGATLDALQELTRLAIVQQTGVRSRCLLDIGGYRKQKHEELRELTIRYAQQVQETGKPFTCEPTNSFERKIIHDTVTDIDGVYSDSQGEEPDRAVVIYPQR